MRNIRRTPVLGIVAGLVICLALVSPVRGDSETIHKRLLKSTGWINCPQPDGTNSWGTCWVYDREQRLVITNKHVINKAVNVTVDFPMYQKGKLVTSVTEYIKQVPLQGKLIAVDDKRDLALCQLDDMLPEGILALPLAATSAVPGNRVFSLGNSSANTPKQKDAQLWRFLAGKVEMRYFDVVTFNKPPKQKVEATSIRCSLKTAGGDSGGPVVNTLGELVAVHSNGDRFNSFSIDVTEVQLFVERAQQRRRPPGSSREWQGTWTLQTVDEIGRVFYSLTLRPDGSCQIYRDDSYEGKFEVLRNDKARVEVPGMKLLGEVTVLWTSEDKFSFLLNGREFIATRR